MINAVGSSGVNLSSQSTIIQAFQALQKSLQSAQPNMDQSVDNALREVVSSVLSSGDSGTMQVAVNVVTLLSEMRQNGGMDSGFVDKINGMISQISMGVMQKEAAGITGNASFGASTGLAVGGSSSISIALTEAQMNKQVQGTVDKILQGGIETIGELRLLLSLMDSYPGAFSDQIIQAIQEATRAFAAEYLSQLTNSADADQFLQTLGGMGSNSGHEDMSKFLLNIASDGDVSQAYKGVTALEEGATTLTSQAVPKAAAVTDAHGAFLTTPGVGEQRNPLFPSVNGVGDAATLVAEESAAAKAAETASVKQVARGIASSEIKNTVPSSKPLIAKVAPIQVLPKEQFTKPEAIKVELFHFRENKAIDLSAKTATEKLKLQMPKLELNHMAIAMAASTHKNAKELGWNGRDASGMGDLTKRPKTAASNLAKALDEDPEDAMAQLYCALLNVAHYRMEDAINQISF